ncbi:hypothetical protein DPEC_G00126350 [Dallia pectoralis]|uniref:Uncharacterized protein n=1 Tax=Dallia pectoralis TaxID=75939 RepID=A0ACC2GS40_DALPE|nr:hypothetical protein DPEC_G00126350 [Dallia pectoralis]
MKSTLFNSGKTTCMRNWHRCMVLTWWRKRLICIIRSHTAIVRNNSDYPSELLTELQLAFFHMAMVKFQIKDTVDLENKAWAIIRYGQRSGVWPDDPWVPNRCRTPFVAYVMEKIKTNLRRRAKTALLEESRRSLLEMTGGGPSQ